MLLSISLNFLVLAFIILLGVVFLLILAVLVYGLLQYRRQVSIQSWTAAIDSEIADAIVNSGDVARHSKISDATHKSGFRRDFLEKLVSAEKKFSGGAGHVIRSLFEVYGLEKESLSKLKKKRPYMIAGGIQELTAMKVEKALPAISQLLQHESPQVYQEAQYSVVRFEGFDGLTFLNDAQGILSEWQQLRLLNSIPAVPQDADSKIRQWLQSENSSVIIFVLRLIRKYQLLNMYTDVLQLLSHRETEVRNQSVQSLQALENSDTLRHLETSYDLQPEPVRIEILKAVIKMGDRRAAEFYTEKLLSSASAGVKILAAQGLCDLGMTEQLISMSSQADISAELSSIIKHALQEKI